MLTKQIAEQIVRETMTRLNRNINIMDHEGKIIASGDLSRIYHIHEGALQVIETGKPLIISQQNQQQWKGSLPGMNLPIEFQNKIIGVIGITGDPQEIKEFAQLVKMITEMMISQSFLFSHQEWKLRMNEQILEELLQPEPDLDSITRKLNLLGIQMNPPFQTALLELSDVPMNSQELIQKTQHFFSKIQHLSGFLNANRMFILVSGMTESEFRRKLESLHSYLKSIRLHSRIGLGSQIKELGDISISLAEAKWLLQLTAEGDTVIAYLDVEAKILLHQMDPGLKQKFANRIFGHSSKKTRETLEAFFFQNLNIEKASQSLFIHRNTLIYRLKKIKESTGYDPQCFEDAVVLQLALWIHQMNQ